MDAPQINLLMAEDDENDILLFARACRRVENITPYFVHDGLEATQYLEGVGPFSDRSAFPFPDWLMLDLKMPRMDGFAVLEWLRAHPQYLTVPTLVFSASEMPQDVARSYQLGAHAYFAKPASSDELICLLQAVVSYWRLAKAPRMHLKG